MALITRKVALETAAKTLVQAHGTYVHAAVASSLAEIARTWIQLAEVLRDNETIEIEDRYLAGVLR